METLAIVLGWTHIIGSFASLYKAVQDRCPAKVVANLLAVVIYFLTACFLFGWLP